MGLSGLEGTRLYLRLNLFIQATRKRYRHVTSTALNTKRR